MKKYLGNSVEKLTRRQMVAGSVLGGVAMIVSACGGGGGGGSSNDEIDLVAAYDRVLGCMSYEDVVKAVGVKPNLYDAGNTLKWKYGDYVLYVGLLSNLTQDKELFKGLEKLKRHGFTEDC
ncbi:hypothetical protein [Hydrogenophaga sp. NFH-34]|uniref:hypothetical protein n=1 Tax=Hydrogenophaga sp. NFH-34 TaxID=2744446 RepID=UPI001F1B2CE1|nr:hypothetical protein [Hydrogenophaga sp. NFH-34]